MNLYQQEIIKHAKTSEQNMRVAILTGLSYQELRHTLIRDFANAMKQELQNNSWDDIDIRGWLENSTGTYTGITCRQAYWPNNVFIKIETQSGGIREYIIGVKAEKVLVDEVVRRNITSQLNDKLGNGKSSDWWPWYRELDDRYRNFDCEETLLALYHKKPMLNELVGKIEEIGKALDSIPEFSSAGR